MNDSGLSIFLFLFGIILGVFIAMGIKHTTKDTYKDGQIDAMNGIIKYKKELQKDSTVIWVEIKQNE